MTDRRSDRLPRQFVMLAGVVLLVPSVRNLRRLDEPEPEKVLAAVPGEPAEAFHGR